jgi:hypothetical protein
MNTRHRVLKSGIYAPGVTSLHAAFRAFTQHKSRRYEFDDVSEVSLSQCHCVKESPPRVANISKRIFVNHKKHFLSFGFYKLTPSSKTIQLVLVCTFHVDSR